MMTDLPSGTVSTLKQRLDAAARDAAIRRAQRIANPRSSTARQASASARSFATGLLTALSILDGRYGEGLLHTAKRYGVASQIYGHD